MWEIIDRKLYSDFLATSPSSNSGCKIISKLAWVSKLEMNFGDISPNACNYMECPLEANTEAVFNATFYVSKMWPTVSSLDIWKLGC